MKIYCDCGHEYDSRAAKRCPRCDAATVARAKRAERPEPDSYAQTEADSALLLLFGGAAAALLGCVGVAAAILGGVSGRADVLVAGVLALPFAGLTFLGSRLAHGVIQVGVDCARSLRALAGKEEG